MPVPFRPDRTRKPGRSARPRLHVESLEDRLLLSAFLVTSTANSGAGSLSAAITSSNSDPGLNTISFDITGNSQTISPISPLPAIKNPVIIDGTSQPGYSNSPIIINGTGSSGDGLVLACGSDGSTIEGLDVGFFTSGAGIALESNDNTLNLNTIQFNQTGIFADSGSVNINAMGNTIGATTKPGGNNITNNQQNGILIGSGGGGMNVVEGNTIGQNDGDGVEVDNVNNITIGGTADGARNDIFGNFQDGIQITGDLTSGNLVQGNWIGTDTTGTGSFGNLGNGIEIDSSGANTIGGTSVAARNVISGNYVNGVWVNSGDDELVEGNFIGVDVSGQHPIPNGVGVALSGVGATIGGTAPGAGNIISANNRIGINITGGSSDLIQANLIAANGGNGISVAITGVGDVCPDTIGGTADGAGNIIQVNFGEGIELTAGSVGSRVMGNNISSNADNGIWISGGTGSNTIGGEVGNSIRNNSGNGVLISPKTGPNLVEGDTISGNANNGIELNGAFSNTIGGIATGDANTLTSNNEDEVLIQAAFSNTLEGNLLSSGYGNGIDLTTGSVGNVIGGTTPASGNTISGQAQDGVRIASAKSQLNMIEGNLLTGNGEGLELIGATANFIGGTAAGAGNVISGNTGSGITLATGATNNFVLGNLIGTDATGRVAQPNGVDGVDLVGATYNTVGGTSTGERNVISGNAGNGISLTAGAENDQVLGNFIGINASGSASLPNGGNGVSIARSTNNCIGGTAPGDENVISGNGVSGISLGTGATGNQVLGNDIGTGPAGLNALPNQADGVDLDEAMSNIIGGTAAGACNVVSGNAGDGINLTAGASGNQILQDRIGTNASGTNRLPNGVDGVNVAGSNGNTIGGTEPGDRNIISGNAGSGIDLVSNSSGNLVLGNDIGTDISGENPLGNSVGITINAASGNTIGGAAPEATNVISGNTSIGVQISNSAARGNSVLGNLIGTNQEGNRVVLPPDLDTGFPIGVLINDSPGNSVGGTAPGDGNVISGFGVAVNISGFNASGNAILGDSIGTDQSGNVLDGATGIGVYINGAAGCSVGGTTPGAGNIIQGYSTYGVLIFGSLSTGNVVQGNRIGLATRIKTGRLAGVAIESASSNTVRGNTISGNRQAAVYIFGQNNSAVGNVIAGNQLVRNLYGILLYNAANNGSYTKLRSGNQFAKSQIADVREFTGAVPSAGKSRRETSSRDITPSAHGRGRAVHAVRVRPDIRRHDPPGSTELTHPRSARAPDGHETGRNGN